MGSVTPLIALAQELRKRDSKTEFFWIGTRKGPEKDLIEKNKITFKPIFSGKLRRYFSLRNFTDLFLIKLGFYQSLYHIIKFKPDAIVSAGGFVSVPVIWAGWVLRKKCLIHQLDVKAGLANKICARFVKKITISFEKTKDDFNKYKKPVIWTGVPVREEIFNGSRENAIKIFNLQADRKVILALGGGTGAQELNNLITQSVPELTKYYEVIHLTGKGKNEASQALSFDQRYHFFEFITEDLVHAFAAADVVISRCGIGTLSELAALGKVCILIPIPDSHQEKNAEIFSKQNAAIVLDQNELTPEKLIDEIRTLISDESKRQELSKNIKIIFKTDGALRLADEVLKLISVK